MRTLSALRQTSRILSFVAIFLIAFVAFQSAPVQAGNSKYAGIVIDAKTGRTLYSPKADVLRYPASLTKMMTLYMVFDALESGKLSKKTRIVMSKYAASKPPSKLGVPAGRSISAEQAIYALVTKSANDVAAAVAEHLGGSESQFAVMMTNKARQLGMSRTTFKNASGLTAKGQLSTARDMAMLGIALREHFPRHYRYFSTRTFKYGKKKFGNHNRLLGRVKGMDGIKTGYTRASGFNLVSSVQTGYRSIVAVVMGGRSGKSRNAQMRNLISKYLKKASRGNKKLLIAARAPSTTVVASLKLPKRGPVPLFRQVAMGQKVLDPNQSGPVVASLAYTQNTQSQPVANSSNDRRLNQAFNSAAPVPAIRPRENVGRVDKVVTASVAPSLVPGSGWVIQIAASDSKSKAIGMLERARSKAPEVLNGKVIYTETVAKGNAILHRARFVGFESKDAARNACKVLKRKKFACLALAA